MKAKNDQTNNYQVAKTKELKERINSDYFNAVILQTLNAPYSLDSKVFKRDNYYYVALDIQLTTLDDMIAWELNWWMEMCWI